MDPSFGVGELCPTVNLTALALSPKEALWHKIEASLQVMGLHMLQVGERGRAGDGSCHWDPASLSTCSPSS